MKIYFIFQLLSFFILINGGDLDNACVYEDSSQIYLKRAFDIIESDTTFDAKKYKGFLYFHSLEFEKAIQIHEEILKNNPEDTMILRVLGKAYYFEGNYSRSLEIFSKLASIISDPEAFYYLGKVYEKSNCMDEAVLNYRRVIAFKQSKYYGNAQHKIARLKETTKYSTHKLDKKTRNIINESLIFEKKYVNADALTLLREESYKIEEELTISQSHKIIKVLTMKGRKKFGEVQTVFDATYETVNMEFARIIKPNSQVIEIPQKSCVINSPFVNYSPYSNTKVFTILFPELEEGAIIEYKISKRTINPYKYVCDNLLLQDKEPIILQRYEIDYPTYMQIKTKVVGTSTILKQNRNKERVKIAFELKNQPGVLIESYMPPLNEVYCHFLFSSFTNWDDVYNWWKGLYSDKITIDNDIKQKVKELTWGIKDSHKKAKTIYEFVAQNIRYIAISYGEGGYKPRTVAETFRNRFGDCKDQALLFVSMLREAKIEAYPVLLGVDLMKFEENFPSLQFNHCIAVIKIDTNYIFLDPTRESTPFECLPSFDQDKTCMVFFDDGYKFLRTPLFPLEKNLEKRDINIVINDDYSIDVHKKGMSFGEREIILRKWFRGLKPIQRKEILEKEISNFCPGGILEDYSIHNLESLKSPLVITENFHVDNWLRKSEGKRYIFKLPTVVINISGVYKKERRFPISYRCTEKKEYNIIIKSPQNFKHITLPNPINLNNANATFSYQVISNIARKEIIIKISYSRSSPKIPLDSYSEWKSFADKINRKLNEIIEFELILND
jgi:hypothetical protein